MPSHPAPHVEALPDVASVHAEPPRVLWLTGLSGSGKSTLACALQGALNEQGKRAYTLDGDVVRRGLCRDLGFSPADRSENIRRIAETARLMCDAGLIVIVACISPLNADREAAKAVIGAERFLQMYLSTSLQTCELRDVKGLYRQARAGMIAEFTGISSPYEPPLAPDLTLDTGECTVDACLAQMLALIKPK